MKTILRTSIADSELPEVTQEISEKYGGQTAGIADGKFVAFGNGSVEVTKEAQRQGYELRDLTFVYIFRPDGIYA